MFHLPNNITNIAQDQHWIALNAHSEGSWLEKESTRNWARERNPTGQTQLGSPSDVVTRQDAQTAISQAEEEIQSYLNKAFELLEAKMKLTAIYAPITRVPNEVLSQIFVLARPTDFAFVDGKASPYSVLLVCRFWRRVALQTPQLFASFHLSETINSKTTYPYAYRKAKISEWAGRAKSIPWHVKTGKLCREEYWNVIADRLHQWRTWEHQGNSKFIYSLILGQASRMVELEELAMTFKMEPDVSVPKLGVEVTFPALKKMCLGWGALDHLPRLYAPYLTELKLDTPTTDDLEHCASAYPELSTLSLTFLTATTVRCKLQFPKLRTFNCVVQDRLSSSIDGLLPAISSTVTHMTLKRTMPSLGACVQFPQLETIRLEQI